MHTTDFDAVYDLYADMLYRIAISHLCNQHDAEDIVQETFVSYFSQNKTFDSAEHLKAWLIRVAVNKACDRLRRQKVRNYIPLGEIIETVAATKAEDGGLLSEVMLLPEKYKTPIILHYFEDFSIEDISKILKTTLSGTKMRLKRGRDMLRIRLEQDVL